MILKDVVKWLLDNGYMQIANNQLVVLKKLNQEAIGAISLPVEEAVTKPNLDNKKEAWAKFVADCEIPHIAITNQGNYYLRHYSPGGGLELFKILHKRNINYTTLVEATKRYYKTAAFKKTLLNYLKDGLWEEAYNDYLRNPISISGHGENPFEV